MSNKDRKNMMSLFDDAAAVEGSDIKHHSSAGSGKHGKMVRKVSPLGMRVLVRLRKDTNMTEAGLYLPEGAKQSMQESVLAEVIEVASAIDEETNEEANVSGVPLGAIVLISKEAGIKIPWDDDLRIVETKSVLAIVHEISVT